MASGLGSYGTLPSSQGLADRWQSRMGRRNSSGRKILVAAGLAVCAVAVLAAVFSFNGGKQVSLLDISKMEAETFQDPAQIYDSTLADAVKDQSSSSSLAWAHPRWAASRKEKQDALASLENHIVAGVTKQLASQVSKQVSSDLAGMLRHNSVPVAATSKQGKMLRKMESKIDMEQKRLARDEQVAKFLRSGKGSSTLANAYEDPIAFGPKTKVPLPFHHNAPVAPGPSDTYSYWLGAHYHDEEGPPGVKVHDDDSLAHKDDEEEAEGAEEPEGAEEQEGAAEEEGAEAEEGGEEEDPKAEAQKFWDERDNREKLVKEGVNVNTKFPDWVMHDLDRGGDEEGLNDAGVVTDALPGVGHNYHKAIPNPVYEKYPTAKETSDALEQGHRYVSPAAQKLENEMHVHLAGPNVAMYGPADKTTKMDDKQEQWPYMDGMEDNIQEAHSAKKHKPLTFFINDVKKGSQKLEGKGVNVWGAPISLNLPQDFFDGRSDEGAAKLKKAGVRVDRLSLVPNKGPTPFE
eukprot:CAMPEP_0181318348 /NCGR_PEP_ID=MMETSP1101-20121128/16956_1 /TAXON_ID=46948 /ORGANISM="Rhodomonas abbreviata, Strain Caron Lab Isolate" /LENGTH=517 /DNA_ID=CAMNT_0023425807 /DNA_START=13 /DNA_END=1566 /DNA_ORIENTATION=+